MPLPRHRRTSTTRPSISSAGFQARPFAFEMLFEDQSAFNEEIGRLFGSAFLIILVILGFVFFVRPVGEMSRFRALRCGVDYSIHLNSRYREEVGAGDEPGGAAATASRTVGVALVLATVTTAVGFLTSISNPLPALRDFGILAAVGIVAAFLLMLTFVPAVRLLLDRRAARAARLPRQATPRSRSSSCGPSG